MSAAMHGPPRRTIIAVALAFALAAPIARAQTIDEQRARADALFREGQELLTAGQTAVACAKLEESERLDPKLGRLLNLAYCHEQLGKTATAWSEYNQAAALASQTGQTEREAFARGHAVELASKLSFLQLDLKAVPDLAQATIDGRSIGRDQLSIPFPADPGSHTLTFAAPGYETATQTVVVGGAGTQRVVVAPLEREHTAGIPATDEEPAPLPVSPDAAHAAAPGTEPKSPARPRTLALWVGGASIVVLAVGAAFGLRALLLKGDADSECPNHLCTPPGLSTIDDAKTSATIADVGLIVGAAGFGVATWLFFRAPPARATAAQITPLFAPDRAGLSLHGSF